MTYILGWIVSIILIFITALLLIPFEYRISGTKYDTYCISFEISWLFRVIRFALVKNENMEAKYTVKFLGFFLNFKPSKKREKKKEKDEEKKRKRNAADFLNMEFFKKLITAFVDVIAHIKPRKFVLSAKYGFYDPCDTGMLCAFLSNVKLPRNTSINLKPVFEDEILEGKLFLQGRLIIAVTAVIALRLLLSRPVRNILKKRRETKLYVN